MDLLDHYLVGREGGRDGGRVGDGIMPGGEMVNVSVFGLLRYGGTFVLTP